MNVNMRNIIILVIFNLLLASLYGQAVREDIRALQGIDISEHLGKKIPLDLKFTDDSGQQRILSEFFDGETPVLLNLAYYECPMLCTFVLNGTVQGMQSLKWNAGKEYRVLTVSIDPRENSDLAARKKKIYLSALGRDIDPQGWVFAIGEEQPIKTLADAVGFEYYWDEEMQQFAHPAALFVLSGDGTISRYLYGIEYKEQDLRLALLEASEGKIGSTIDRFILYCFHYDPDSRGYVLFASNVMKLGGVVTLLVLGLFLGLFWRKEIIRRLKPRSA